MCTELHGRMLRNGDCHNGAGAVGTKGHGAGCCCLRQFKSYERTSVYYCGFGLRTVGRDQMNGTNNVCAS